MIKFHKKYICILKIVLTIISIIPFQLQAQSNEEITDIFVVGKGDDKNSALENAFREAIEKTYGVYIYSKTKTIDYKISEENIIAISKGAIADYKIIHEEKKEDQIFVGVKISIKEDTFLNYVHENSRDVINEKLKDAKKIKLIQKKYKAYADVLSEIVGDPNEVLIKGYNIEAVGYTIDDIGLDYIKGAYLVQISANKIFWGNYMEAVSHMLYEGPNYIHEGLLGKIEHWAAGLEEFRLLCMDKTLLGNKKPVIIHESLENYLAPSLDVAIRAQGAQARISLYKNGIIFGKYKLEKKEIPEYFKGDRYEYENRYNRFRFLCPGSCRTTGCPYDSKEIYDIKSKYIYKFGEGINCFWSGRSEYAVTDSYIILRLPFKSEKIDIENINPAVDVKILKVNGGGFDI